MPVSGATDAWLRSTPVHGWFTNARSEPRTAPNSHANSTTSASALSAAPVVVGATSNSRGLPQPLLDRWSSRHHQVQAAIEQRLTDQERELSAVVERGGLQASEAVEHLALLRATGQLSPRQERLMGTVTRTTKTRVTVEDLDKEWQRTALHAGINRERIEVLTHQPRHPLQPAERGEVLEGLTEFDATFKAREARAVALEQSAGAPIQAALEQLRTLRNTGEILLLADGTGTTRDHRAHERAVVAITQRLAVTGVERIPVDVTEQETQRLDVALAQVGGRLSGEQRAAIELGCGEHALVVIEGHAGTGKSTTLTGIARAHQATGRQIIVTSTAALAAERLAAELQEHGVQCAAYSTLGLQAAINHGRVELDQNTTVIHDEAALASTREQVQLLRAVETSGARLIVVGDPRQNQPVGAGGLWDQIEQHARDAGAHVELTVNQRAQCPADRHAQSLFRKGEIESAIRTYAAHDRIHLHSDQQYVEDQALEAAHQDRAAGQSTLVIAQTSNDQLDQLNARAQAIRRQHGELGDDSIDIPERPYGLRTGDLIQIRHTINHPEHGQLRNGTNATVTNTNPRSGELVLQLAAGSELTLDERQIEQADLRLAYVQHPFPVQGHTTDTTHVIIGTQATREGTYVALTRSREQTQIYSGPSDSSRGADRLEQLAERVSQTEPEIPSISAPLAHEAAVTINVSRENRQPPLDAITPLTVGERLRARDSNLERSHTNLVQTIDPRRLRRDNAAPHTDEHSELAPARFGRRDIASRTAEQEIEDRPQRVWPRRDTGEPRGPERDANSNALEQTNGWEM
jgi:MoxR-like ATPase